MARMFRGGTEWPIGSPIPGAESHQQPTLGPWFVSGDGLRLPHLAQDALLRGPKRACWHAGAAHRERDRGLHEGAGGSRSLPPDARGDPWSSGRDTTGVWGRRRTVPEQVRQRVIGLRRRGLSWSRVAEQLNAWRTPTGQGGARWYASTARKLALRDEPDRCPMCGSPLPTPSGENRGTRARDRQGVVVYDGISDLCDCRYGAEAACKRLRSASSRWWSRRPAGWRIP